MRTDKEADDLLEGDLSEYMTKENFQANFTPVSFEFAPKDTSISIRLSGELLHAVKAGVSETRNRVSKVYP
jgi:predicted DNA binding CopG/RHH family protein